METVKTGLGLTSKNSQEGTEPLSGETGKGTSTEPYDQGNATGERPSLVIFSRRVQTYDWEWRARKQGTAE